jgi:hypothetical protein
MHDWLQTFIGFLQLAATINSNRSWIYTVYSLLTTVQFLWAEAVTQTYLDAGVTFRSEERLAFVGDVWEFPFEKMNNGTSVGPYIGVFLAMDAQNWDHKAYQTEKLISCNHTGGLEPTCLSLPFVWITRCIVLAYILQSSLIRTNDWQIIRDFIHMYL